MSKEKDQKGHFQGSSESSRERAGKTAHILRSEKRREKEENKRTPLFTIGKG